MKRKAFLKSLSLISGNLLLCPPMIASAKSDHKITELQLWELQGERMTDPDFVGWIQSSPGQYYDKGYFEPLKVPKDPPKRISHKAFYLKILTATGLTGLYGPIDYEAVMVIQTQVKDRIIGLNAMDLEYIWDMLFKANRHSRGAHYMIALSAIDNVLWDIRGKAYGDPVYQLLGGGKRNSIPVYASCLGYSIHPDRIATRCRQIQKQGFTKQKWFFGYGPAHGGQGMEMNIGLVQRLRETLGNTDEIMFDAWKGWTSDYALQIAKRIERYYPSWIEEPFQPQEHNNYEQLAQSTTVPLACGEHLYNKWEFLPNGFQNVLCVFHTMVRSIVVWGIPL